MLAAILFHFVVNAVGELFAISTGAEVASTLLSATAALVVIVVWRAREAAPGPPFIRGMDGE